MMFTVTEKVQGITFDEGPATVKFYHGDDAAQAIAAMTMALAEASTPNPHFDVLSVTVEITKE